MKMKLKTILTSFIILGASLLNAQNEYKSSLKRVKLYSNGAEVHRVANVKLVQGTQTIVIKHLSTYIDPNSIIIGGTNNVSILSTNIGRNRNRLDYKEHPKVQKQLDSLAYFNKKRREIDNKKAVLNAEIRMLQQNSRIGGNNGVNIAELEKATVFFNKRYTYLYAQIAKVDEMRNANSRDKQRVNARINQLRLQYPAPPRGQITVQINAEKATQSNLSFSYLVRNARWYSTYEARCEEMGKPIALIHKASITQRTGENWENVKLELSTGNPNIGVSIPRLYPRYLSYNRYNRPAYSNRATPKKVRTQYLSNDAPETEETAADAASGSRYGYGGNNYKYTTQTSTEVAVEYTIDRAYSLPSTGQVQLVTLKTYDLPATYNYYTVPKMGRDVYLVAKMSDWQKYNLLSGQVSLFYKGSYVGKTNFNPRANSDTLELSLGKDPKVIVNRKVIRDYTKVKTIGSNKRESLGYSISLNNTNNKAVTIEVVDQIPISKQSTITVEVTEKSGGSLNEKTGELRWTLTLKPGKTKTIEVGYDVTSPKNKTVYGL